MVRHAVRRQSAKYYTGSAMILPLALETEIEALPSRRAHAGQAIDADANE
jgi:hypothetical protein